ncbi:MAG: hypothetical protein ABI333_00945 [bacterium]
MSAPVTQQPSFARALTHLAARLRDVPRAAAGQRLATSLRTLIVAGQTTDSPTLGMVRVWPPDNVDRLDPTWLVTHPVRGPRTPPISALHALPGSLAAQVAAACGWSSLPPRRLPRQLCEGSARWTWADLVDMPPAASEPSVRLGALDASDPAELSHAVPQLSRSLVSSATTWLGVADFAGLLGQVPDRAAAAVCARLPTPLRREVWSVRSAGAPPPPRATLRLEEVRRSADPAQLLFAFGVRILAHFLADHDPLTLQQTAQLLPVSAALLLLRPGLRPVPDNASAAVLGALRRAAREEK